MQQAIQGLSRKTADGTITQNSIRDDSETVYQLCNRFRRTFLHNARTRQITDEALLVPFCVFTDTLLPLRNGHFPGNGCVLKCTDAYGGSRGWPKLMVSDNGSNYVGAARGIMELVDCMDQEKLKGWLPTKESIGSSTHQKHHTSAVYSKE